jgi:uncharacterized protein YecT (DUF1311 family)
MLRLTCVFLVWVASTAYALDDAADNQEAELHEAYILAWNEADDEQRKLLARAQHAWNEYRAANCEMLGEECYALMAHERTAELRYIERALTETNDRTILHAYGRADKR